MALHKCKKIHLPNAKDTKYTKQTNNTKYSKALIYSVLLQIFAPCCVGFYRPK